MAAVDIDRARAAQSRLARMLGDAPNVNGIGLARAGEGFELKVNLVAADESGAIPGEIDGVTVRADVVGPVRRLPA